MRKKIVMALLVVAILAALMGTADAVIANDPGVGGILERGIFAKDENDNLVELIDREDFETLNETVARISDLVSFHLYSKKNPSLSQVLVPGDSVGLHNTNWDANKPTRIVTHGWRSSGTKEVCISIRDAYLEHGDYNVIIVDWSKIAKWDYSYAARRVGVIGTYVALLIDFLELDGMDISKLVVQGHSLGGHIAGLSSRHAKNTVGYVVALDPAGPLFEFAGPGQRVDKTDAANVQVIHTSQGKLGLYLNVGHMDFRPNGAEEGNGCAFGLVNCSRVRAYEYFAESINSIVGFYGQRCDSWSTWKTKGCSNASAIRMGGSPPVSIAALGSYYLETADTKPYAKGHPLDF